ncbi:hypothetical protein [Winogradskyella sp. MIT101101]|uniref:hypothetical protein n=1 Tax=Winogradskyella sp. MIT101101 TaxID=3098297 RepID=UPI00399BD0F5
MAIKITEKRKDEILINFIENPTFYKYQEFQEVREIIVSKYRDNLNILEKISNNDKTRRLLSSSNLLHEIMNNVSRGHYDFALDEKSDDIFFILKQFSLHEDSFFTHHVVMASMEFITFIVDIIDEEIINTEKIKSKKSDIDNLYSYFIRVVTKLNIQQTDQTQHQALFNKIEQLFKFNNFKNASTWFRFYFYFRDKKKFSNNIESKVVTNTTTFIRNSNDSEALKEIIEEILPIDNFIKINISFLNEIYNKSMVIGEYAIVFYPFFDENKKQELLNSWVLKNPNQLSDVIKGIKNEILNKVSLANQIIERANSVNNLNKKKSLINVFFALGLSKEDISATDYNNLVSSLIFNTDINMHNLGITQLLEHREYIDTKSLKPEAEAFLRSTLGDSNSYHELIQNIIDSRLGITTKFVNDIIYSNLAYLSNLSNYLINSGNLEFYEAITSKLNKTTINTINNRFINGINKHKKYYSIINHIKDNYFKNLTEENKLKLNNLIGE